MRHVRSLRLLAPGLLLALSVQAQDAPRARRVNLNGEWTGMLALEGGNYMLSVVFDVSDTSFAGTMYMDSQEFGRMEHGKVNGDSVYFSIDRYEFWGVVAGSTMKTKIRMYNGTIREMAFTKKPSSGDNASAARVSSAPPSYFFLGSRIASARSAISCQCARAMGAVATDAADRA
jgi:hypothetical protein